MKTDSKQNPCITERQDIDYAFMFKGFTIMVLSNGAHEVIDKSLGEVEKMLQSRCFLRIHRSYLVNMKRVREMEVKDNRLLILLRGNQLPVARRKRKMVLDMLRAVN